MPGDCPLALRRAMLGYGMQLQYYAGLSWLHHGLPRHTTKNDE